MGTVEASYWGRVVYGSEQRRISLSIDSGTLGEKVCKVGDSGGIVNLTFVVLPASEAENQYPRWLAMVKAGMTDERCPPLFSSSSL